MPELDLSRFVLGVTRIRDSDPRRGRVGTVIDLETRLVGGTWVSRVRVQWDGPHPRRTWVACARIGRETKQSYTVTFWGDRLEDYDG